MTECIQVIQVSKSYAHQAQPALRDVSLTVNAGEFVALMGPSGCGKSTLLNLVGAIDRPTAGRILLESTDLSTLDDTRLTTIRRDRVGFVFQFFNLLSTLTVAENVALPLALADRVSYAEQKQRAHALLERLGIQDRSRAYPAQLSGGEMQRAAIARALIHSPDVLLADEPTGNLDTENGRNVLSILRQICSDTGQTILMATHSDEAAAVADRVIQMRDGAIVSHNAPVSNA